MSKLRELLTDRISGNDKSCTLHPYSVATRNFRDSDATSNATAAQPSRGNPHVTKVLYATDCATATQQISCTTSPKNETDATAIATRAIAQASLTDEQKASRLADLRRDPAIARFWALAWPEALNSSSKEKS